MKPLRRENPAPTADPADAGGGCRHLSRCSPLTERRLNVLHHIRQIVTWAEIYGSEKTARAIEDAFEFQAFSSEYIATLLEQRQRILPEPGALHLTRRQDLLDLELPEPNLALYEMHDESSPTPGEVHGPPQDRPCDAG